MRFSIYVSCDFHEKDLSQRFIVSFIFKTYDITRSHKRYSSGRKKTCQFNFIGGKGGESFTFFRTHGLYARANTSSFPFRHREHVDRVQFLNKKVTVFSPSLFFRRISRACFVEKKYFGRLPTGP